MQPRTFLIGFSVLAVACGGGNKGAPPPTNTTAMTEPPAAEPATPATPATVVTPPAAEPPAPPPAPPEPLGPKDMVMLAPKDLKWGPAPASIPAGAELAVVSGDPKAEGPFVMRLRLPAKYKLPNHWHPAHEHVSVIEGALWLGHGDTWDEKAMTELPVGGFAMMPPKHSHYVMTKKKTVIQVHAWGPWGINYIRAEDDPRTKTAAAPPAK